MELNSIYLRPIKSFQTIKVVKALTSSTGLVGDSLFCLIDDENKFLSLRTDPHLSSFKLSTTENSVLRVNPGNNLPFFELYLKPGFYSGEISRINIWGDQVNVCEFNPSLSRLFSDILNKKVKLVALDYNSDPFISRPRYVSNGQVNRSLQDGYNYSLINSASLAQLESWYGSKLNSQIFRPNFIMDCDIPFIEDTMIGKTIQIGTLLFRVIEHIPRCSIINQNYKTGIEENDSLIQLLAQHRFLSNPHNLVKKIAPFGVGLTFVGEYGNVSIGDKIKVLD